MPKDDLVDKALDAAFDKIDAAEPDPVEEPVEEPQTEVEEEQPLAAEAEEQISDKEANVEEDKAPEGSTEAAKPVETNDEPIEIPAFLSAETKALLAEATPALRKKMISEYEQRENTTRRALQESSSLKAERARVEEVVKPHSTRLRAMGIKETADIVDRALAWDELITKDPRSFIIAQMKQNGISPQDLLEDGVVDTGASQYQDPRVDEALEAARAAKEQLENFQLEQQRTVLSQELETFKSGKDARGATRKAFVEMFQPQIAETIKQIKANPEFSHLDRGQVLHEAYEYVVQNALSSGFQFVTPAQPKPAPTKEEIAKTTAKQQAASGSVRGAPASGTSTPRPKLKGKDFNEKLESALDIGMSRAYTSR